MRSFVWSSDLLVGHDKIDQDHRHLVDLSGEIEDLIATQGDAETLRRKLAEFYQVLAEHCAFEESLMHEIPGETFGDRVNEHVSRHAILLDQARELLEAASGNSSAERAEIQESGRTVVALLKRLIQEDKELIGFLLSYKPSTWTGRLAAGSVGRGRSIAMYMAVILAAVLLLLTAMLGLSVYETKVRVESEIRNSSRTILRGVANDVAGILQDNRDAMERIARRPLIRQPTQKTCDPILWEFKEIFPRFANATTIEPDGTALCSAVAQPGGKPVNVFKAEWFQRAIAEKDFVVGKPFLGPITGRWVSVLVMPVYNDGGVLVRYLGFPLDLAALTPSVGNIVMHQDTVIGIATPDGLIVWRNKDTESWVGKSLKDRTAFANFIERGIDETTAVGVDNVERTYRFGKIEESGWIVWVGVPTSEVRLLWLKVLPPAALLGLFGLLVLGGISYLLVRRIVKPMSNLADTARSIRNGQLDARASYEGPREVVAVAREINAMLDLRERQTEELMRSNVELERFAYVASHDLQEPVRTVVAYSQLLERRFADQLGGEGKDYLNFIIGGAKRMGELVRDLLNYSRISGSGKKYTAVDMALLVKDVEESLQALIVQNAAAVIVDSSSLPVVQGDKMQLMEVFQNLLVNAVRFRSPDRPPLIRISATSGNGYATICVSDNGIGIERPYWEHIFQVFKRLHGPAYPGTGIGLAICKRIVEGHGGRIWVLSTPNEGSSFFFTLPTS